MTSELLDLNAINELKEMLEDDFLELFVVFKDNSRKNIDNLKTACEQYNIEDMFKYAHILKGSCGNLGLTCIFNLMSDLEEKLKKDDKANVNALMLELETIYVATISELVKNNFLET